MAASLPSSTCTCGAYLERYAYVSTLSFPMEDGSSTCVCTYSTHTVSIETLLDSAAAFAAAQSCATALCYSFRKDDDDDEALLHHHHHRESLGDSLSWANERSPSFLRSKWRTNVRQWECHPRDVRPPLPLAATKACGQGDGCASRSFALLRKPNVDPYVTTFRMCIRTYTHRGSTSDCISVSVLVIQLMLKLLLNSCYGKFAMHAPYFITGVVENICGTPPYIVS